MTSALRQKVIVQPGGVIEIKSPDLPVGASAEVIVLLESAPIPPRSLVSLIGAAKGGFASTEEIDTFIRREREAWHS
jgi:hypothetical protein